MSTSVEQRVEYLIKSAQQLVDEGLIASEWEIDFIDSVAEQNETKHLTGKQIDKLEDIVKPKNRCGTFR